MLSLAKDQTEINHIILEASKGSKFYEVRVFGGLFVVVAHVNLPERKEEG